MTNASLSMPSRRVEVWFSGTAPQRRATVIFRIILAIPQFVVLFFLGIAAIFVAVIGWFAALFTGRLPEFAHNYLGGLVRWEIRVNAYLFLLTDEYPPFTLEDVEYPVRPILPGRGPLNRVSVFFRIILAVPAAVFAQIVVNGLTFPLIIVMWFVVLVTGRMPPALYTTYSAALRYQTRFHSWFDMLTSEYAWGMFGDFVPPPPPSPPPAIGAVAGVTQAAPPPVPPPASAGCAAGPASGAAVHVPVDRRAGGDAAAGLPRRRPRTVCVPARSTAASGSSGHPRRHATALVLGAHVDPLLRGTAAVVGDSRPARRGQGLDDLCRRLGFDHLCRPECLPRPQQQPQHDQWVGHDRAGAHSGPGFDLHRRAAAPRSLRPGR